MTPHFRFSPHRTRDRLPSPLRDERSVATERLAELSGRLDWSAVVDVAAPWVRAVRDRPAPFWALESLLHDYPITSAEGLALMRLAEALLRVPDADTAAALAADQLGRAGFEPPPASSHPWASALSSSVMSVAQRLLHEGSPDRGPLARLGASTVVAATVRAIGLLGQQFVLGRRISEALDRARRDRAAQPGLRYSFDMLGEGARTEADALRHLAAHEAAIDAIAAATPKGLGPAGSDGISIKLSALFCRFEEAQRARVGATLLPRVWELVARAAAADLHVTLDAEESDRLELSLDVFDALASRAAREWPQWQGLGLAVQAYQTRAADVIDEVARIARAGRQRLMVRLVKGAYWDSEVKRAQELGLSAYPVFTHKHHTDLSYLACAARLLAHGPQLYPQFATHNAGTLAALARMTAGHAAPFELQRLHGMGEAIHREAAHGGTAPLRIYAPVGEHRELLAYLVRRLLENGANSSFVHQLTDSAVPEPVLLASPLHVADRPGLVLPPHLYGPARPNARGVDLQVLAERQPLEAAVASLTRRPVPTADAVEVGAAMVRLQRGFDAWRRVPLQQRAQVLRRAADALERRLPEFCALLVVEARKTLADSLAEVREAIDFCRYYAAEAERSLAPHVLPGPTGESNTLTLRGRGVFACISPWNFPLAIFAGQVVAALVAGNTVAAKPAEQTPEVAGRFAELLQGAGLPPDALAVLHGPGERVGAALVAHPCIAGVCFTGSTPVARHIARALAAKDGPLVPLIAETGGINAMVVDSSALPEQVVDAVVQSAFRSAGQRCSALRLLCVHDAIAEPVMAMIAGALQALVVGDPARWDTDVGPLIDRSAREHVEAHIARLDTEARRIARAPHPDAAPSDAVAPVAFEVTRVADLHTEVFGPVLHVVRWSGDPAAIVAEVNALGYGLTLGLQTRLDGRALGLADLARAGNVYVNRNMVGAVVGVQPFGGEGLSGTGPKAGGPHYLPRFCTEQTLTINTAAAGGNVDLLSAPRP